MNGTIKTYLPEKKYGFIKGDDGKDYFFHASEFRNKSHIGNVCEEAPVNFDQQATAKGYKAKNCSLIRFSEVLTYVTPDEFIASKSSNVRGWNVLEGGSWVVHGESSDSPDAARTDVIDSGIRIGANALLNLEYYKTTGSNGNYNYSIHHFRGYATTLAKKNPKGSYRAEELSGLNQQAETLKKQLVKQTKSSKRKSRNIWLVVAVFSIVALGIATWLILLPLIVGFIFGGSTDYDYWLERA